MMIIKKKERENIFYLFQKEKNYVFNDEDVNDDERLMMKM